MPSYSFVPTLQGPGDRAFFEYSQLGLAAAGVQMNGAPQQRHADPNYAISQFGRDPVVQRNNLQPYLS